MRVQETICRWPRLTRDDPAGREEVSLMAVRTRYEQAADRAVEWLATRLHDDGSYGPEAGSAPRTPLGRPRTDAVCYLAS